MLGSALSVLLKSPDIILHQLYLTFSGEENEV